MLIKKGVLKTIYNFYNIPTKTDLSLLSYRLDTFVFRYSILYVFVLLLLYPFLLSCFVTPVIHKSKSCIVPFFRLCGLKRQNISPFDGPTYLYSFISYLFFFFFLQCCHFFMFVLSYAEKDTVKHLLKVIFCLSRS